LIPTDGVPETTVDDYKRSVARVIVSEILLPETFTIAKVSVFLSIVLAIIT
jgi:hypothetical protein